MSEKPILFSSEMVNAILEGRKTQTRRALKVQPIDILPMKLPGMWVTLRIQDKQNPENNRGGLIGCRYGRVGDRLWVRETWRELIDLGAGTNSSGNYVDYKADHLHDVLPDLNVDVKWKPSIFMPRWASRITLEIVSVRAERVQTITPDDVLAEGIRKTEVDEYWLGPLAGVPDYPWGHAHEAYAALWNSINEKRGYGWDANPWVWVIEFKQVEQ